MLDRMICTVDETSSSEDDGLWQIAHIDEEEHAEANAHRVEDNRAQFTWYLGDEEISIALSVLVEKNATNSIVPVRMMLYPKLVPILPSENWIP